MSIITLTSDWGIKDHYIAAIKGSILSQLHDANIVDISHNIPPFDIEQASFILKNCYRYFPKGTIHIIGVNSIASPDTPHIVVQNEGSYFIGADNGFFSLLFDKKPNKIVEIDIIQDSDYFTFSSRDVFVKAACILAKGGKIGDLGEKKDTLTQKMLFKPVVDKNIIKGIVIYTDVYENAITNITESLFNEVVKNNSFIISFRGYDIDTIRKSYHDVPQGEILALFGSGGHLEIAMNQGNASSLLGLHFKDTVMIEF